MKILMILSRFPYPLEKGDKLRAYHQLKGLSEEHEVHLICLNETKVAASHLKHIERFCASIEIIYFKKWLKLIKTGLHLFSKLPFQVAYFSDSKFKKHIQQATQRIQPDVVFSQMIRVTENLNLNAKTVHYLDYMDTLSVNMERRFEHSKWYEKPLVQLEKERLKAYEKSIFEKMDGSCIISNADREKLPLANKEAVKIIPNGIDNQYFEFFQTRNNTKKNYDLIFTGNMGYHPNVQACKFLVNRILPILAKKGIRPKVCLAGARPTAAVQALANEQIEVTGFVDDLRPYLAQSKLFVAPLFSGSGLQNKLLECMAMGLPTLTTSIANDALKANPENEIRVKDTAEIFANEILYLLENEEIAEKFGKNGRQYVLKNFRWKTYNDRLISAFEDCINEKKNQKSLADVKLS